MTGTKVLDLLRANRLAVAMLGVALLLSGAWSANGAYSEPKVERSVEREVLWTETSVYSYGVPVTRNSTHIPIGTLLPMGQPAYFRTISDAILIDHVWSAGDVRGVAAARMSVHVDAVTSDGRPYWSIEHLLAEASTHDAAAGLSLHARLDLDALLAEYTTVSKELPVGEGVVNWTVRTNVLYALDAGGVALDGGSEHTLPFLVQDPRILVPGEEELRRVTPHAEERVHVSSAPRGVAGVLGSARSLALLGLGLSLLALYPSLSPRSASEAFDRERRRFREFVSVTTGIPATTGPVVDVHSLEDLVHVAVDARTRVLLDPGTRTYYALLPGVAYRYAFAQPEGGSASRPPGHSASRPLGHSGGRAGPDSDASLGAKPVSTLP